MKLTDNGCSGSKDVDLDQSGVILYKWVHIYMMILVNYNVYPNKNHSPWLYFLLFLRLFKIFLQLLQVMVVLFVDIKYP